MTDHTVTVVATRTADGEPAYRAVCSACRWKGQRYPLARYVLAEHQAQQHTQYVSDVGRLTAKGGSGE